jgi:glycosyltransferase involved in cell wall biosynthesis
MIKKKVLIVSRTFYPVNSPRSFRTTELANELARQGHDVTVIIPKNHDIHSKLENEFGYVIKNLGSPKFKNFQLSGFKYSAVLGRMVRRLLLMLFEYPDIEYLFKTRKALLNEDGYDLLISIAVPFPIHWGVAWARKRNHRIANVWVADCGDPYIGCKTDSFKKLFYFKFVEKWFCRKADYISIPNQDHLSQYLSEFEPKIKFISQGFKFENSNIYKGQINNEIPTFCFAGVLLKAARNPTVLMEYLSGLQQNFKFILYTNSKELLIPFVEKLGARMEIRSYITRDELIFKLSQMDFLVNIEFHSSVQSNSPSKLIDYAIADRPILSLNMENFEQNKVDEFLVGNYSNKLIINDINKFRIENVVSKFIQLTN